MQATNQEMDANQCLRCKRKPMKSIDTNVVFETHICYEDCGNVFWTLKECISCKAQNATRIIQKPRSGQLVTCSKCSFSVYYFRCPYQNCKRLIYKTYNNYIMGMNIKCSCQQEFKLVVCPCGGQIFIDPNQTIIEGFSIYNCRECLRKIIYTICTQCLKVDYHKEKLQVGDRFKCGHCLKIRAYVPCPKCGKSLPSQKFYFGQPNHCHFCNTKFQLINCPIGCGLNFFTEETLNQPLRTCSGGCNITFLAVTCLKCYQPLYMDQYAVGVAREEECPSCRTEVNFYLCYCGMLTMDKKCVKTSCPKPKQVVSYTKQWKQEQKKKQQELKKQNLNDNYEEKTCKLCITEPTCMVNIQCKHAMMCQPCFKMLKERQRSVDEAYTCPICKQKGRYQKIIEPIYQ